MNDDKNVNRDGKISLVREIFLDRYYTMPISQQEFDFLQQQQKKNTMPNSSQTNQENLDDKRVDTKQQGSN